MLKEAALISQKYELDRQTETNSTYYTADLKKKERDISSKKRNKRKVNNSSLVDNPNRMKI
jgi:hypothetical protein